MMRMKETYKKGTNQWGFPFVAIKFCCSLLTDSVDVCFVYRIAGGGRVVLVGHAG